MVSIIVPVYNAAKFVSATLDNLLAQNVNKEIILVNDGSTDESLSILEKYAERYSFIRVINKTNGGVSSARNVGLKEAKGDFVMFVDADDQLDNGALMCVQDVFTDDIDVVFSSYKEVVADGTVVNEISYLPTGKYTVQQWTADSMSFIHTFIVGCVGSFVVRRRILSNNNVEFNEYMSHYEDIAFGFEFLQHVKNLYYINKPLYWYMHINPHNLFGGYNARMPQSAEFCLERVTKVISADRCAEYIREVIYDCIRNESIYTNIPFSERLEKMSLLSKSKYLPYMQTGVINFLVFSLIKNGQYRLLIFLCHQVCRFVSYWVTLRYLVRRILRNG